MTPVYSSVKVSLLAAVPIVILTPMSRRQRPPTSADLGPKLLALRTEAGLTQREVAERMGLRGSGAETAISRAEHGRPGWGGTWTWIARFAAACGFDADVVFKPRK